MKAAYNYNVKNVEGKDILCITDLWHEGSVNKTVTNSIEEVVEEIGSQLRADPKKFKIVYRDVDGTWDGWDPINEEFIILSQTNEQEAINKLLHP